MSFYIFGLLFAYVVKNYFFIFIFLFDIKKNITMLLMSIITNEVKMNQTKLINYLLKNKKIVPLKLLIENASNIFQCSNEKIESLLWQMKNAKRKKQSN